MKLSCFSNIIVGRVASNCRVLGLHTKAGGRATRAGRDVTVSVTRSVHIATGSAVVIMDRAKPPPDCRARKSFNFVATVFIIGKLS